MSDMLLIGYSSVSDTDAAFFYVWFIACRCRMEKDACIYHYCVQLTWLCALAAREQMLARDLALRLGHRAAGHVNPVDHQPRHHPADELRPVVALGMYLLLPCACLLFDSTAYASIFCGVLADSAQVIKQVYAICYWTQIGE